MADEGEKEGKDFEEEAKENLVSAEEIVAADETEEDDESKLESEEDDFESDVPSPSSLIGRSSKGSKPDSRRILSPMILRPVIPSPQIMRRLSQGILQEEISQHKPGVSKSLLKSHSIAGGGTGVRMRDLRSHHPPPRRKSSTFGSTFGANHDTTSIGGNLQRSQMYKSEER